MHTTNAFSYVPHFLPRPKVERVKRVLSSQHQARVEIESLVDGHDFSETLTRARFEEVRYFLIFRIFRFSSYSSLVREGGWARRQRRETLATGVIVQR